MFAVLAGILGLWCACLPAFAAGGPIETSIFAVQGVDVDVTSTDAATARNEALMDVQVKAFEMLAERLGTPQIATEVRETMKPEDIAPYLRSLSIEQESSAPGRYIGRFTVRFLPEKTQKFFAARGVRVPTQQGEPVLVIPVYRAADGVKLWEDNPWHKAWADLKGEQGMVPIIVPLGDLEDTETLTAADAVKGDAIKLEAIRKRYGAPSIVVAQAQPADGGGLHVYIAGETKLGEITINKIYDAETGSAEPASTEATPDAAAPAPAGPMTAEAVAVASFQKMLFKTQQEQAAKVAAEESARNANRSQSLAVSVPFTSPREWNAIRSRILSTPNVSGVDLSSLSAGGAVIQLVFTHSVEELQSNMQSAGLSLTQSGAAWVIQPM